MRRIGDRMKPTGLLAPAILLAVLGACSFHTPAQRPTCAPRPGEIYGSTADSLVGGVPMASVGGQVDTERMIQPDPAMRTYDHMHALRYELRRFRAQHNRLPNHIEEFSPSTAPGLKINVDGWGSSIRYTRLNDRSYEFRAPGPDHTLCTRDDMVARNDTLPRMPAS